MKQSLFEQFEDIENLHDAAISSSGRVKSIYKRKIAKLTEQEGIIEDIIISLEKQRVERDQRNTGKNLRSLNPPEQRQQRAKLQHTRSNFAQRAFCLPIDYKIKFANSEENNFIQDLVIHPEFIPDEFLVKLHEVDESIVDDMSFEMKVRKKIELIPILKIFLQDSSALQLGQKNSTGRICINQNPNSNFFGKFILFQEITDIELDDRKKRKKIRKIIPKIHNDVYSLMRGQNYATSGLRGKIDFLSHIRDQVLPNIFERWKDESYTGDDKRKDIDNLISELKGKLSYHEKRALEDRINKIKFDNLEQDKLRLMGAYNDIIKELEEKIGKLKEIGFQLSWLMQTERQWRITCDRLIKNLSEQIVKTNVTFVNFNPENINTNTVLTGEQANSILKIWKILIEFNELTISFPQIGKPYHEFNIKIHKYIDGFRDMRKDKKSPMGLNELKITLGVILSIKKLWFESVYSESIHRIKIGNDKVKNRLHELLDFLENIKFLPQIALTEKGDMDFIKMTDKIREIIN